MEDELLSILNRYSAVSNSEGTDKNTSHSYYETYSKILRNVKNKQNPTILEIGIYSGAFLEIMAKYIPSATIDGIDIDLSNVIFCKDLDNVHIYQMDGTDPSTPSKLNKKYDLIIEDASHLIDHQIKTLDLFAPLLKEGGIYIIEDISTDRIKPDLQSIADKYNLHMEWLDLRNVKNRYDDIIAVFTRK